MVAVKDQQRYSLSDRAKFLVQSSFRRFGYQLRRLDEGVSMQDPHSEQIRLLGDAPVKVIFEVGAYNGRDTLRYAADFPGAQVYAFEPIPESFGYLSESVKGTPNITAVNSALYNNVGTAAMHLSTWIDASSLHKPLATGATFDKYAASDSQITVSTDTLDHFCREHGVSRIDLLKIDAQGAEFSILQGGVDLLSRGAIRVIFVEVAFSPLYEGGARFDQVMELLCDHGFRLHNLYGLVSNQRGELAWGDALFVKASVS
ncbi:MAG: FkbM family methyltransferase [Gammaproteobacteria bacterium]